MNTPKNNLHDIGLLLLRVLFASTIMYGHGWAKLMGWAEMTQKFPDPIGLGSTPSLVLAIGAEVVCAVLVVLGLFTRVAVIPLCIMLAVAVLIIHAGQDFANKEMAMLYFFAFFSIGLLGPGRYSLDAKMRNRV